MKKKRTISIQLDGQGHLILPDEVLLQYGLTPGSISRMEMSGHGLVLSRSSASLARVYVEPTNACNLDCSTCMRNVWEEPLGKMSMQTFERILQGMRSFVPTPLVFFGGFGEPLAHPDIHKMVAAARQAGAEVELITNGTLLDERSVLWMIKSGLNRLWVSIDGATPESYADVRLGDALPLVISNLKRFQGLCAQIGSSPPKLGIAFVAMKRNVADLPEIIRLGRRLGADLFSITNVLAHTAELRDQILYAHSMYDANFQPSRWFPEVALPRMDPDEAMTRRLAEILKSTNTLQITRQSFGLGVNTCPFLEKGSVSIRWDGEVSPCLPLLHTHTSYLAETLRTSHAYSLGNVQRHSLMDLWNSVEYVQLRERLQIFDFSPCTFCNSCEFAEANLEDCFGNTQPACGGCLWAQGFIQCP